MTEVALMTFKFVLAVVLLPLVLASTLALQGQIVELDAVLRHHLWVGMVGYLLLKCFVYDFDHVYRFGQGMVTFCFQFLKPLVSAASFVIPIYTIFVLLAYALMSAMGVLGDWKDLFFVLISATFSMHIILTAQDLYEKDTVVGKPTYFFGMQLIYIVDIFMMALLMNAIVPDFSFPQFFKVLSSTSFDIYQMVFMQLFGFR